MLNRGAEGLGESSQSRSKSSAAAIMPERPCSGGISCCNSCIRAAETIAETAADLSAPLLGRERHGDSDGNGAAGNGAPAEDGLSVAAEQQVCPLSTAAQAAVQGATCMVVHPGQQESAV
jgi:hypothetical protein